MKSILGYFSDFGMDILPSGRLKASPSPHYSQLLVNCFGVFLNLDHDYMCSETDFIQEKRSFSPNSKNHHSSLVLAAALSQNGQIAIWQKR